MTRRLAAAHGWCWRATTRASSLKSRTCCGRTAWLWSPPASSACPSPRRTRPTSSATRASRRSPRRAGAACPRCRTISASASRRSAARPASFRRAGRHPARILRGAMARVQPSGRRVADRRAWFVCALCLAWPDGHAATFVGRVDGSASGRRAATSGFGYDPMFVAAGQHGASARWRPADSTRSATASRAFAQFQRRRFPPVGSTRSSPHLRPAAGSSVRVRRPRSGTRGAVSRPRPKPGPAPVRSSSSSTSASELAHRRDPADRRSPSPAAPSPRPASPSFTPSAVSAFAWSTRLAPEVMTTTAGRIPERNTIDFAIWATAQPTAAAASAAVRVPARNLRDRVGCPAASERRTHALNRAAAFQLADILYLPEWNHSPSISTGRSAWPSAPIATSTRMCGSASPRRGFAPPCFGQLAWEAARLGRRRLTSIFFGGGTPV